MFVRATKDLDFHIYNIRSGQLVELPADIGGQLVANGEAVVVEHGKAVEELAASRSVETAAVDLSTAETASTSHVKRGGRVQQTKRGVDDHEDKQPGSSDLLE